MEMGISPDFNERAAAVRKELFDDAGRLQRRAGRQTIASITAAFIAVAPVLTAVGADVASKNKIINDFTRNRIMTNLATDNTALETMGAAFGLFIGFAVAARRNASAAATARRRAKDLTPGS